MQTLTVIYGIDHRLTTAYHLSANGLVERMNKEVSRSLKKYTEGTYAAWDEWMPLVQIGLNEGINQRTGSTAFSLMFGRKFNNFRDFSEINGNSNLELATNQVKKAWKEFKEVVLPGLEQRVSNVKKKQETKLNKDRKQVKTLQPGTIVMALDQTRGSKWDLVYEGPFEVVKQHKGGAYSLKDSLGRIMERKQTIDMLKVNKQPNLGSKKKQKHFSVEKINNHRQTSDGYEYLVKWKHYGEKDNSWVKAKDFSTQKMIKDYWKKLDKFK